MSSVYEWPIETLLDELMKASAQVGTASMCIDVLEGARRDRMHLLRGAILARFDEQQPPFKKGDRVAVKTSQTPFRAASVDYWGKHVISDDTITVRMILYRGRGRWVFTCNERDDDARGRPCYKAADFELVVPDTSAVQNA